MINLKNKHFGKQNAKFKQKDKTPYDVIIESFKSTKNVFKRVHIYILAEQCRGTKLKFYKFSHLEIKFFV